MAHPAPRSLQRYREKRDFERTSEPTGVARRSSPQLEFVIQRHHARRLHYDFRLEWDGVLKSWAVPKGPSLDPADKRLAVQVEDHPFEYRKFSGEIPAGEYGAGRVIIWDRGTWVPEGDVARGLVKGKLDFELEGERLHGKWALVRLQDGGSKPNWLLIKRRDEYASRASNGLDVTELYTDPVDKPPRAATNRAEATRERDAKGLRAENTSRGKTSAKPKAKAPQRTAARRADVSARVDTPKKTSDASKKTSAPPAKAARRVEFIPPQLATSADAVPAGGHWLTELKFDGYRILSYVDGERVHCFTRSGLDWSHRMPSVARALSTLGLRDAWLDGELIAVDAHGIPQFQRLQQALDPASGEPPVLMVFDALRLLGADLRDKPLRERKRLLQQALADLPRDGPVRLADFVDGNSEMLRERACVQGFEGVILKDAEADYRSGRNRAWLKLKCRRQQEFVIGGYTRTEAGRDTLTALLLGYYDDTGKLQFAGRAGTGFSEDQLGGLRRKLDERAQSAAPFQVTPKLRRAEKPVWVKPDLVALVRFAEWTESGILRQPLFLGLREDLPAQQVRREPDRIVAPPAKSAATAKSKSKLKAKAKGKSVSVAPALASPAAARRRAPAFQLTHPERVLYPTDGITKQQLAEYYEAIAPVLWPHLKARPLSLVRATNSQARVFFQRHIDKSVPGLTAVEVPGSDEEPYFVCASQESIPLLAQMGAVELHTWGSRMPQPQRADRITFDLDPDPTLPWPQVRDAAILLRGLLTEMGLQARLKTSGGQGLHLVVPLMKGPPFEVVAAFSRRVAEHLARLIPQHFSAKRGAPNRQGRIYVDWQRNQFAATTVAAYSPRHRPGVSVSLPIDWDELGKEDIRGPRFNLRNVAARIAEHGDAWESLPPIRQTLTQRVIDRLEAAN